jgi:hypothetical protein
MNPRSFVELEPGAEEIRRSPADRRTIRVGDRMSRA